ncbi:hypothetical protein PG989_011877 [Apiospora arundinis]
MTRLTWLPRRRHRHLPAPDSSPQGAITKCHGGRYFGIPSTARCQARQKRPSGVRTALLLDSVHFPYGPGPDLCIPSSR